MTITDNQPADTAELCRRAEEIDKKPPRRQKDQQILHQLSVHQIELELQNEALRQAQVELDAERARYFDLYNLAPVGYVTLNEQGLILETNLTATNLLGVAQGALVKQPISRFILLEDHDSYYLLRKQLLETGEPKACDLRMVKSDGTSFWGHLASAAAQNADGMPVCRVVMSDITERKQAEEEKKNLEERLKRSEKMDALGRLAGGVAHDMNNVLGVLMTYSELLVQRIPADNPLQGYAINMLKSSERGAAIIQDLLTMARRGVVVCEVIDFNNVVSNFLATPEFDRLKDYQPKVTFEVDLAKDLLNIKGSPVHLEKAVMNLVSNAAEAIISSGKVKIRTENRYLDKAVRGYDEVCEGDYAILTVSDNGRGISTADLDKIFEPFYTKKAMGRSGTGLGLSIVWGTVKDHEGYIDVQSIEGRGTTFTLYFPVTREKIGEDAQKIPIAQYMGHGESIMVVDDVQEQRQVATTLLTQLGYQVDAVSSGEDLVEYLKSNKVDVLVLDMIMEPGIDGLETYRRVIEINPRQKAIIVSGFSETDRVRETQKLGAGAYVKKPYVIEKIGMAIRDELHR